MIDIKLNKDTHDLELIDGDLRLVDGIDSLAQGLKIRLGFMVGEWFKDTRSGVIDPDSEGNLDIINSRLKAEIKEEYGVVKISQYEYRIDGERRIMTITFSVDTLWGKYTDEIGVNI